MHLISIKPHDVFQALSDPIRIRMLRLVACGGDECCLCEFSDSLREPGYKLSRHLKIMRQAGLLNATKDGRWVYHRLVKGDVFLNRIYESIRVLPDEDRTFHEDLQRFRKRMGMREDGKCRTDDTMEKKRKVRARR